VNAVEKFLLSQPQWKNRKKGVFAVGPVQLLQRSRRFALPVAKFIMLNRQGVILNIVVESAEYCVSKTDVNSATKYFIQGQAKLENTVVMSVVLQQKQIE
jgi:hypothetical protein